MDSIHSSGVDIAFAAEPRNLRAARCGAAGCGASRLAALSRSGRASLPRTREHVSRAQSRSSLARAWRSASSNPGGKPS